ncbi:hypothetical protein BDF21DRAFT_405209 [Thamnidium elegans]|nr:hypothetical protein BDF21DRAFT_405209 [Thamnidium elegans]
MEEVYDFLQHTHFVVFQKPHRHIGLGANTTHIYYYSTSKRDVPYTLPNISWGNQSVDDNEEDTVQIDVSREKLHQLFKKGKDSWDQDDLFTLTAVSDFIRLSVEA